MQQLVTTAVCKRQQQQTAAVTVGDGCPGVAVSNKLMQETGSCYLSKLAIGLLMSFPLEVEGTSVAQLALQVEGDVVEQLPQHTVAEAIVVKIHLDMQSLCHAS